MRVRDIFAENRDGSRTAIPATLGPTVAMALMLLIWPLGFIVAMIDHHPLPAPPLP